MESVRVPKTDAEWDLEERAARTNLYDVVGKLDEVVDAVKSPPSTTSVARWILVAIVAAHVVHHWHDAAPRGFTPTEQAEWNQILKSSGIDPATAH